MGSLKVSLFTTSTSNGQELSETLRSRLASQQINGHSIQLETFYEGDSEDMLISGLQDDVVIFDASVEDEIGSNYKTTKMWPLCM